MKKLIAVLLVLCISLGCAVTAMAARPSITKQPEMQTVKAGGTCTFSVKAKNTNTITWYFVNPATGEETTGRKLSGVVDGVKVKNPNSSKITLKKVPEEMHGWSVYCKVSSNGYSEKSDSVLLLIDGMPDPSESAPSETAFSAAEAQVASGSEITVTAKGALLQAGDSDPAATLTLTAPATFTVSADGEADAWLINGFTLTSDSGLNEFTLSDVSCNMTIVAKSGDEPAGDESGAEDVAEDIDENMDEDIPEDAGDDSAEASDEYYDEDVAPAAPVVEVGKGEPCAVTCTNCTFTGGGFTRATSGEVPSGTTIRVTAGRKGDLTKGYRINGGAYEHANEASFTITVKSVLDIVMP